MPELVVVVGPSGAGKTTWARTRFPDHAHPDAEEMARTLFADPARFRYYPWVRVVMRRLLAEAVDTLLGHEVNVVVAARGATPKERHVWWDVAVRRGATAHLVRLVVDADTCVARARADRRRPASSRAVWPKMVANWYRDWQPPTPGEGHATYREVVW